MVIEEREKNLAEKIRELLTEKFEKNYEFRVEYNSNISSSGKDLWLWNCYSYPRYRDLEYPVKTKDGRELGTMFMFHQVDDLKYVYFDGRRKIIWPDDFIDPYPITIDYLSFYKNHVDLWMGELIMLDFLSEAYYAVLLDYDFGFSYEEVINPKLLNREDRMKLARIIPGVIKDIEVFLRCIKESLEKRGIKIDFSKAKFYGAVDFPLVVNLENGSQLFLNIEWPDVCLSFPIKGMKDEEIIDNIMKRVDALAEIKRKFRKEWLPSEERRKCYESTMRYPEDPYREGFRWDRKPHMEFRKLINWPTGNKEEDRYYKSDIEFLAREEALRYEKGEQTEISSIYNLDGYRLELVNYEFKNGKIIGGRLKINKKVTCRFPLEKIEFLKEEFPELWKKSRKRK